MAVHSSSGDRLEDRKAGFPGFWKTIPGFIRLGCVVITLAATGLIVAACGPDPPDPPPPPPPSSTTPTVSSTPPPPSSTTPTASTPQAKVQVTYPSAQAQVTQKEEVRGSSEALPEGSAVWVAVYLPEAGRYYPEPAAAVSGNNGAWSSTTYIGAEGGDFGKHFDILATVADGTAQAAFTAYNDAGIKTGQWPGMADLAGAQIYDRVPVVRG